MLKRLCLMLMALCLASAAQARGLLRDPDIEYALGRLAAPILAAAGLNTGGVRIVLVNDREPNAFVLDNNHIFIHSGLILKLENAAQVQAVIAHEVAHITGGHLVRRATNMQSANITTALGIALSGVAMAAGAGEAAPGIALGMAGTAQRVLFGHTRAEEAAADQAGIRYMAAAGVPPEAMLEVLDIFRGQEVLAESRQDPYARSHPLSRDRLRALRGYAAASKVTRNSDAEADYWYARAKGKLEAFTRPPSFTLSRVKASDTSDIGLMRRAVALHRKPDQKAAIATINQLVATRPNDPYYAELQGQILLESRQFTAAVAAYRRAAAKLPREAQVQAGLGRALLATGDATAAVKALDAARAREPWDAGTLRFLAQAYAQTGNQGMATLTASEARLLSGDPKAALPLAKRAAAALGHGSVGWRRAQDVIDASEKALAGRK